MKANDEKIRSTDSELAAAQAMVKKLELEYPRKPKGNDLHESGRKLKAEREQAKKDLDDANLDLAKVEKKREPYQDENKRLSEEWKELDPYAHPEDYPMSTEEKGNVGESEGRKYMERDEQKILKGEQPSLGKPKQKFKFLGSSKEPKRWRLEVDPDFVPPPGPAQGLDGVYENTAPPPKYVVVESKYDTARLRREQKTFKWVDDRLDQAVGFDKAQEIRAEGFEYWALQYKPKSDEVQPALVFKRPPTNVKKVR